MLAAPVLGQIGVPRTSTVTPVEDDLEKVLVTKRRLESRDEEPAPERLTGDDAQASRLRCHEGFRVTRIVSPTQSPAHGMGPVGAGRLEVAYVLFAFGVIASVALEFSAWQFRGQMS